ncbi:MAG TPA: DNA primase, partial [Chitinophagaceae bacterium]|nr:DNA primase [Chitinophagaceae bacterium]
IAETISKINKVEDFTKQQDYIRRCAEVLKIEEAGLNALVNKFIREKIQKQEAKSGSTDAAAPTQEAPTDANPDREEYSHLFNRDELQERGLTRCLIEFGSKPWDEEKTVADFVFEEIADLDMLDNKELVNMINLFRQWYDAGREPGPRDFLYHEDSAVSTLVVSLMEFAYELSPNWSEHYEGKIPTREELYKEEVNSTVNYLKLRKVKRMIVENQKDLERPHEPEELLLLLQTHKHLKEMEQELTRQVGTVIFR